MGYWDEVLQDATCPQGYELLRHWIVRDKCDPLEEGVNPIRHIQSIIINDTRAPEISCIDDITLSAGAHNCFVAFDPMDYAPQVTDLCSDEIDLQVRTSIHASILPLGTYSVTYVATDGCRNTSECTMHVTVEDNSPPVAVCETFRQISVNDDGQAVIYAASFDDGSYDNCSDQVWFKARRMELGGCDQANGDDSANSGYQEWFDDQIYFCCEDIDQNEIIVVFRVYDTDPGAGPVDPNAYRNHWNECMVRVQVVDKLPPAIECPADMTIACDFELDLEVLRNNDVNNPYGIALIDANCDAELSIQITEPADCDAGKRFFARTFTATERNGLTSSCTQRIYLEEDRFVITDTEARCTPISTNHSLTDDVEWPCDLDLANCPVGLAPDDLSQNTNRDLNGQRISINAKPQLVGAHCAEITMDYEDQRLTLVQDACFKILRTWTITDWCQFDAVTRDPHDPDRFLGYWQYIQIIKVKQSDAPRFLTSSDLSICDEDTPDCTVAVDISVDAVDDCTPDSLLIYQWTIDLDSDGTIDLEGFDKKIDRRIPKGHHTLVWRAEDGCGNIAEKSVELTLQECKKPTPVCINGVATVVMPNTGSVDVWASDLDASSFDNCTASEDLIFTIRKVDEQNTPTPSIGLDCSDLPNGVQDTIAVELWVTDEAGNTDNCITYILLQDTPDADNPEGVCPDVGDAPLAGRIMTHEGREVRGHPVEVLHHDAIAYTRSDGQYLFSGLSQEDMRQIDFVQPSKNDDASNGVTTLDLIAIQRHILGVESLNTSYRMIAADADNSRSINVLDLLELQQIILGLKNEFSHNRSWRYISADEVPPMSDPYTFEEPLKIEDFTPDQKRHVDFTAVKIGDVNGSVNTGIVSSVVSPRSGLRLIYAPQDVVHDDHHEIRVPIRASNFDQIEGYQFTLNFDAAQMEFVKIESGVLDMSPDQIMTHQADKGKVSMLWYDALPRSYAPDQVLFTIVLKGTSLTELSVGSQLTRAESYKGGQVLGLSLAAEQTEDPIFVLFQNEPNPFKESTKIRFDLPEAADAIITILDAEGQEIYSRTVEAQKGFNEVKITKEHIKGATGVFYYRVNTEAYTATKKMIRLE